MSATLTTADITVMRIPPKRLQNNMNETILINQPSKFTFSWASQIIVCFQIGMICRMGCLFSTWLRVVIIQTCVHTVQVWHFRPEWDKRFWIVRPDPVPISTLLAGVSWFWKTSNGNIFPHYWPFVRGIHRWRVDSPHKCQWCGALMFPLICAWTNGWANNWDAGDLRRHRTHYDVTLVRKPLITRCTV